MIYIKSYQSNKNGLFKKNFLALIIIFVAMFELIILNKNKLKSEDFSQKNIQQVDIESITKYVVGISKDNVVTTKQTTVWGSGIIVSKKGYILTNAHVCGSNYSKCFVVLDYNNYYEGEVVWSNDTLDLAFVKVNVEFKDCINLGDSDELILGQDVYSIGNPINIDFQRSVGKGIISGLNRNLEFEEEGKKFYMGNLIQTDAVINYGNSGGALVDINGNLIGINTIKITDADLMGFAIPVNIVKPIINKLEENGSFVETSLNIWCLDKYSIAQSKYLQHLENGVLVAQVDSNSNAEKAGLRVGDVIKYIDTEQIDTVIEFKRYIFEKNVGDKVMLKVYRDNKEYFINVEI